VAGNSAGLGGSAASKVAAILMTFTDGSVHAPTEIARRTNLPMSTAHRLVSQLAGGGLLERTTDGHYRIGVPLLMIANGTGQLPSLRMRALDIMEDLARATHTEVRLGVLKDLQVAHIEKLPGPRPVSALWTARTLPAHATALGRTLLAFAPGRVVDMAMAQEPTQDKRWSLTVADRFHEDLAEIRLTRIATSRGEHERGVQAIAMPVFAGPSHVVAAIELRVCDVYSDYRGLEAALTVATRILSRKLAAGNGIGDAREEPNSSPTPNPRASLIRWTESLSGPDVARKDHSTRRAGASPPHTGSPANRQKGSR